MDSNNRRTTKKMATATELTTNRIRNIKQAIDDNEENPLKRVCLKRLVESVETEYLTTEILEKIASSSTGIEALYHAMTLLPIPEDLKSVDPIAVAHIRGREVAMDLLKAEGGYVTIQEACRLLGDITPAAVNRQVKRNSLIAINRGTNKAVYPLWQFLPQGGTLPGLKNVLKVLKKQGLFGWSVLSFFLNENIELDGKTPLQALRDGKIKEVVSAADSMGEMGQ